VSTSKLYTNPAGLHEFQARLSAYCYIRPGNLAVADQGLGKSHIALATISLLFEDDKIDQAVLICEQNKVDEWMGDIAHFTALRASLFYGPKRKIDPMAQIVVSTYSTWAQSVVEVCKGDNRILTPTPVFEHFRGQ
jgi:hypothetical protein